MELRQDFELYSKDSSSLRKLKFLPNCLCSGAIRPAWLLFSGIGIALFCLVSFYYVDIPVLYYCWFNLSGIKPAFEVITRFGYGTWYFVGLVALIVYFRYINQNLSYLYKCLFILTAIALSGISNSLFKFVFGRYRPIELIGHSLYGFNFFSFKHAMTSFPSGHANLISALMLAIVLLFPRCRYVCITIALMVMASRVIIGAHYFGDVIFGSYVGVLTTLCVKNVFQQRGLLT